MCRSRYARTGPPGMHMHMAMTSDPEFVEFGIRGSIFGGEGGCQAKERGGNRIRHEQKSSRAADRAMRKRTVPAPLDLLRRHWWVPEYLTAAFPALKGPTKEDIAPRARGWEPLKSATTLSMEIEAFSVCASIISFWGPSRPSRGPRKDRWQRLAFGSSPFCHCVRS